MLRDLVEKLREELCAPVIAPAPAARILACLKKWRRGGRDSVRIGGREGTIMNFAQLLHGRLPKKLHEIIPKDRGADEANARRISTAVVRTIIAIANVTWRVRCNIASGESLMRLPLGKKVRRAAKVNTILAMLKSTHLG